MQCKRHAAEFLAALLEGRTDATIRSLLHPHLDHATTDALVTEIGIYLEENINRVAPDHDESGIRLEDLDVNRWDYRIFTFMEVRQGFWHATKLCVIM